MNNHAWLENLRSKIKELKTAMDATMSLVVLADGDATQRGRFSSSLRALQSEIISLAKFYSKDHLPDDLRLLEGAVDAWKSNPANPKTIRKICALYERLDQLAEFHAVSFQDLLNNFKEETGLQSLLDELIEALRQLINEGGDELTARMARELQEILQEIERSRKSIIDVMPWIECALASVAAVADSVSGTAFSTVVVTTGMTIFKTRKQLWEYWNKTKDDYINKPLLRKSMISGQGKLPPADCTEGEMKAFLECRTPQRQLGNGSDDSTGRSE